MAYTVSSKLWNGIQQEVSVIDEIPSDNGRFGPHQRGATDGGFEYGNDHQQPWFWKLCRLDVSNIRWQ